MNMTSFLFPLRTQVTPERNSIAKFFQSSKRRLNRLLQCSFSNSSSAISYADVKFIFPFLSLINHAASIATTAKNANTSVPPKTRL